ncbi:MAG: hypothetical protein K0Q49_1019 [Haloplasmataceae bacterium]|jgi:zinc transport system permease protein|nr:hypothetical protein [Haloplasmataceae bacterium]
MEILKVILLAIIIISTYFLSNYLLAKIKIKNGYKNLIKITLLLSVLYIALLLILKINIIYSLLIYINSSIYALQFPFIRRAILVGSLVAFSSAFLGTFLVLKKYSMIGDGLAHVSFASVAISLVLGFAPLALSIPLVAIASILIIKLTEKAEIHGDAAIGLISSFSVALGILIPSLSKGLNIDINDYLIGSILSVTDLDVKLSLGISIFVLFIIIFFYHTFFSITFDEEFAKVSGINTRFINYVLSVLTAVTITIGISIIGTLLISSLIIFPTVSSLQISKGFKQTIIISAIISLSSVFLGIFSSYVFDIPPGPAIVMMNSIVFIILYINKKLKK